MTGAARDSSQGKANLNGSPKMTMKLTILLAALVGFGILAPVARADDAEDELQSQIDELQGQIDQLNAERDQAQFDRYHCGPVTGWAKG
jgi:hypothetical protein